MNAVDTNVFVYAFDSNEPLKQAKARDLLGELVRTPDEMALLWQVVVEMLACLRRWESAGRVSPDVVEANIRDVLAMFPLRSPSVAVIDTSFVLRSRFSLSHWDGLILAACLEAGVDTLYSEDMDSGTNYDGLKIVNPFA